MEGLTVVFIALLVILASLWMGRKKIPKHLQSLPGPTGLPIIGYLPFLTWKPYVKLTQLAKTYGPVYSVKMGGRNVVIITDFKLMKDAFARDAFMGRPPDSPFELSEDNKRTGAFNGLPWKEQRRFSLHMLRDLGFGKTQTEEHIKEEILDLLRRMESSSDASVRMSDLLAPSTSNNIASFLFGTRMKFDDPRRQRLDKNLSEVGKLAGAVGWQIFFPWISAFTTYFNIGSRGRLKTAMEDMRVYCSEEMEEHEKSLDPNNIRDYMDCYLLEIQKKKNDPNTTFTKDILLDSARGFFGAGSETVRISADWVMLLCAAYPEVQRKIHREIDEVFGSDRFPSWVDRLKLPYTEATIWEMMRWKSIIPLNLMRYTLEDAELNGYFIPKHSQVLAVLYAVDHEESLWGKDVDIYKPERFLSADGQKAVKPEHFIPFSIGKRSCPGKSLAEIEVFLYVTAILQKFEISIPPGKKADLEGELGIGLQPKRQELCIKLRH